MRYIKTPCGLLSLTLFMVFNMLQSAASQTPALSSKTKPKSTDTTTLYLSFDDGIVNGSRELLKIADSLQIPVTVFLIGRLVLKSDSSRTIWKQMQASHWLEAGNHSYSHANSRYHQYYTDPAMVLEDFRKNADSLGLKNKIARLPGRNVWRAGKSSRNDLEDCKPAADSLAAAGYHLVGWDIEWNYSGTDLTLEPEDDLIFRINQAVKFNRTFTPRQLVILCHDPALENPLSRGRLIAFIQKINAAGNYRFGFLSNYPGLDQ